MSEASTPDGGGPADLWRLWFPWASSFAQQKLSQPINPGWTFGNVIINDQNSSAPQTEQTILAEESYGRQIGKLLDAVYQLIQERPGGGDTNKAFRDVTALRAKVERLKCEAAATRIDQLRRDLELLRASDRKAFDEQVRVLGTLLPEGSPPASGR